jgi:cytochrome P450
MGASPPPPGPPRRFFSGNLPEFRRDRLGYLAQCARDYGDVVSLRLGHRRVWLLNHPDLIEQVLVTESRRFRKHFALRLNPILLGNGLLTSEGDFWLRQRRLIQPAFLRPRIAAYAPFMVAATERMVAAWRDGERHDVMAEMTRLTLEIAAKTLFDAEAGGSTNDVVAALQVAQEAWLARFNSLLSPPMFLPTPQNLRLRRAVGRLDRIIYGFIKQRRQSGEAKNDLLSLLLAARDDQDQRGMSDQQLRDEAMTLFLAGHETTALTLTWTWYLLAQNPETEQRLAAEVHEALGDRLPTVEDLPRLPYTERAVLESLRLYPPAYTIGRESLEEVELGGYRMPRGTTVLMSEWVLQRDPRFWEEPLQFRPERWTPEMQQRLPKFAYFPFGGGPRTCIGNTFAMMEAVLVLATIAQRFRFTMVPGPPVAPAPAFTLRPAQSINAVLSRRQ